MSDVLEYFSRNASAYAKAAHVQSRIADQLMELALPDSGKLLRIIELGAGAGVLTERLDQHFPHGQITAVDWCAAMLDKARERTSNVHCTLADMNDPKLTEQFGERGWDLIASNCALHWADSLADVLRKCRQMLTSDGALVAAVMTDGTLQAFHQVRDLVAPDKPPRRSLPQIANVRQALLEAGFMIETWQPLVLEESYRTMSQMLDHLRNSAFTGGDFARGARLLNRSEIRAVCSAYRDRCLATRESIWAQFECIIFRASPSPV